MNEYRLLKQFLSLCLCIQLFKLIKFSSQLIPKMSLMSSVLRAQLIDLLFFAVVFANSVVSFSSMLFVTLGPLMAAYHSQVAAILSLFRALFGDFDMDDIMNNTAGYMNTMLFLGYLFVAIFIMLSLFLAILAEGQAAIREEEAKQKEDPTFNEYGVLSDTWRGSIKLGWRVLRFVAPAKASELADARAADAKQAADAAADELQQQMEAARDLPFNELSSAAQNARVQNRLLRVTDEVHQMHDAVDELRHQLQQWKSPPPNAAARAIKRTATPSLDLEPPAGGAPTAPGWANPLLGAGEAAALSTDGTDEQPGACFRTETRTARAIMEALEAKLDTRLDSIDERLQRRPVQRRPPRRTNVSPPVRGGTDASAPTRAPPATSQVV